MSIDISFDDFITTHSKDYENALTARDNAKTSADEFVSGDSEYQIARRDLASKDEAYKKAQNALLSPDLVQPNAAVAIGNQAMACDDGAIAIGSLDIIIGKQSIGIGTGHQVHGDYSGAIGSSPDYVTGLNSFAIGNNNFIGRLYASVDEYENPVLMSGDVSTQFVYVMGSDNLIGNVGNFHSLDISGDSSFVTALGSRNRILNSADGTHYVNIIGTGGTDSVGILVDGYDNTFTNIRIGYVFTGVHLRSGANALRNIHPLYYSNYTDYENSCAFLDEGGSNVYDFCYSDQFCVGFRTVGNVSNVYSNCYCYWYSAAGGREGGFVADIGNIGP